MNQAETGVTLTQRPETGRHILRCCGDTITFELTLDKAVPCKAFLCTNIGNARIHREEIIGNVERKLVPIGQDWNNLVMQKVDECTYRITLALTEEGHFECKCGIRDSEERLIWCPGSNVHVNVLPAAYCGANTVYCVFVRQFGANKTKERSELPGSISREALEEMDKLGYSVIPASGTFRDLTKELDHIINRLKCRIIHLLPITATPTTFARMGRYGSPYASQDFTKIDPALAEFDEKASPLEQFFEFVDAAHRRNAKIFIDIAINHTGWASKLQEEHPDWFVRKEDRTYVSPGAWGVTWGDLIELNHKNPELWKYLADMFLEWCRRGVDGFRCDAGYMIPADAWEYIIATVRLQYPETIFLLEGLGGAPEVTRTLLDRANMDWAYSELFQNYSADQIRGYLNYAWDQSNSNGLMIHYAETHDNNRLAAVSERYSKMRVALSALSSSCGAFGFTNGVEWFAKEKIDVHENSALNWGATLNQVDFIRTLNILLAVHPAFYNEALTEFIDCETNDAVLFSRSGRHSREHMLVIVNLNCDSVTRICWNPTYAPFNTPVMYDLLTGKPYEPLAMHGNKVSLVLSPGQVLCLAPDTHYLDEIEQARNEKGFHLVRRHLNRKQAATMAMRAIIATRDNCPVLLEQDNIEQLTSQILDSPEEFVLDLYKDSQELACTVWNWPNDLKREVMLPPGNCLLVLSPVPFHFAITLKGKTLYSYHAVHDNNSQFFALFPPFESVDEPRELLLHVTTFENGVLRRDRVPMLQLAADISSAKVSLTHDECMKQEYMFLQTNGRGAICNLCVNQPQLSSRYDGILLANLNPEIPDNRHMMWRRNRMWMIFRARRQEITADLIHSFHIAADGGAVWHYHVPLGNARIVDLLVKMRMIHDTNAVRVTFHRSQILRRGVSIDDNEPVTLLISPDLEDRGFHDTTRAYMGAQDTFPRSVSQIHRGFTFAPAPGRSLTLTISSGSFTRSDQWQYMVHQKREADRGLDPETDLYSPGYFTTQLSANDTVYLIGQARISPDDELIAPVPKLPESFEQQDNSIEAIMKHSMKDFVVKRGNLKTVIAGYPWFLDWGRDTLIVARGLIAAPEFHADVKKIILQFASLAKDGTICNMISGDDTGNRDTSDAQLWLFTATRDMCKAVGRNFLDSKVRDDITLRDILFQLARDLMHGTPNGIRFDAESGLLFSPPHFTWMDTNYPAGTPREGYPVEIQALWYAAVSFLAEIAMDDTSASEWRSLAAKIKSSILAYFVSNDRLYLSDCLHCNPGTPAKAATPDDHLRPNQLLAITLGVLKDHPDICAKMLVATARLLIPGAIRSLDDAPVSYKLPIFGADYRLLNNPAQPYRGRYEGDEDTSRKVAYHNGTAWGFMMPLYPEAYFATYGILGKATATAILSSMALTMNSHCLLHIDEITDGDYPHAPRGCFAQAWSMSEYYRVWKLLHKNNGRP